MTTETLTTEQITFLEECALEFSDRFTDADAEYKKVYNEGIPPPPIMFPWYGRNRLVANRNRAGGSRQGDRDQRYDNNYRDGDRNRAGGSRYGDHRDQRQDSNYRDRDYGGRDREDDNRKGHYNDRSPREKRFRPY